MQNIPFCSVMRFQSPGVPNKQSETFHIESIPNATKGLDKRTKFGQPLI